MFGPCKICLEKDKRIDDLKAQIATLNALILPSKRNESIPDVHVEADRVMSGSHLISDEQRRQMDELHNEANSLLTGTY